MPILISLYDNLLVLQETRRSIFFVFKDQISGAKKLINMPESHTSYWWDSILAKSSCMLLEVDVEDQGCHGTPTLRKFTI